MVQPSQFEIPPQNFSQLNHATFWGLFILSFVTPALLVWLDRKLEQWPPYLKIKNIQDSFHLFLGA